VIHPVGGDLLEAGFLHAVDFAEDSGQRGRIAGCVLNKVDVKKMRFRESYYSYYNQKYSGQYAKYYAN